ncbi:MAG: hypothetical protein ABSB69_03610 [Solirubrobacteraceae bacterium]
MRRALRGFVVPVAAVAWLAGATGCGASHTVTRVVSTANAVDRTATTAVATPILAGPWAPDQEGYGHVEPVTVFNGGDPTGLVKHIEWLTWRGPRAVGVGSGFYVAPNQITAEGHRAAAVIVAFKLGSCHSRLAYDAVQWYFPEYGEHFKPDQTGYKLCTG